MTEQIQALILSGGYGTRLKPLTENLPKGLLEIRPGFTILDKQLSDLKSVHIKSVFLLIGYLGDQIKQRYKDSWEGIDIQYCEEAEPMGTLWAIKNGFKTANSDVVVFNGDIVCGFNLDNFIKQSRKSESLLTIFVTKMMSPYGILEIKNNKILAFREKPILDHFINGGIYYIKKQALPYFLEEYPAEEKLVENTVFRTMSEKGLIGSYYEDVFWESVDGFKDLQRVRQKYTK